MRRRWAKLLLAHRIEIAAELVRSPLAACTTATITDPERLRTELAATCERGWAVDIGEYLPGVASLAAPIKARDGVVVGAIAISGPAHRVGPAGRSQAALAGYVMQCARAISRELGGDPW